MSRSFIFGTNLISNTRLPIGSLYPLIDRFVLSVDGVAMLGNRSLVPTLTNHLCDQRTMTNHHTAKDNRSPIPNQVSLKIGMLVTASCTYACTCICLLLL